jgi:hypothetical protein
MASGHRDCEANMQLKYSVCLTGTPLDNVQRPLVSSFGADKGRMRQVRASDVGEHLLAEQKKGLMEKCEVFRLKLEEFARKYKVPSSSHTRSKPHDVWSDKAISAG